MPNITLGRQNLNVTSIVRLRPGNDWEARRATMSDGADNVTFRIGAETYIASHRGIGLENVKANTPVRFMGRTGTVTEIDDEVNTRVEGMRERFDRTVREARNIGVTVTATGGAVGTGTAIAGALQASGTGLGAIVVAAGTGAAMGLGIGAAAGVALGTGYAGFRVLQEGSTAARKPVNVHAVDIFSDRRWTR